MYRANRIGTPVIARSLQVVSTAALALNEHTVTDAVAFGNAINGTPVGDYGYTALNWTNTAAMTANFKASFLQQFTCAAPLNGNLVGMEVQASLNIVLPASSLVVPIFGKLGTSTVTTLGAIATSNIPTPLGPAFAVDPSVDDLCVRNFRYQTQVTVYEPTPADISAVYGHGFQIISNNVASNITWFQMVASIRQFNELQAQKPQDPLR